MGDERTIEDRVAGIAETLKGAREEADAVIAAWYARWGHETMDGGVPGIASYVAGELADVSSSVNDALGSTREARVELRFFRETHPDAVPLDDAP